MYSKDSCCNMCHVFLDSRKYKIYQNKRESFILVIIHVQLLFTTESNVKSKDFIAFKAALRNACRGLYICYIYKDALDQNLIALLDNEFKFLTIKSFGKMMTNITYHNIVIKKRNTY